MTDEMLRSQRFWEKYGDVTDFIITFIGIVAAVIVLRMIFGGTVRSSRKKLKDNYMTVTAEMVDLIWNRFPSSYQLKFVYAHPKDGKKRYYFSEKIYYDPVMSNDVKLDYEYTMYVHPDEPACYYVDLSNYVRNYPSFEVWKGRQR